MIGTLLVMQTSRPFILGPFRQSRLMIQDFIIGFPTSFAMRWAWLRDLVHHLFKRPPACAVGTTVSSRKEKIQSGCYGKSL